MTVVVPNGVSSQANLMEIVPAPEGSIDIVSISTAPNLNNAFVLIDSFSETSNVTSKRWHFPPRNVEQVRVILRTRNWREHNGKKVFTYGLQELNMKLVEYRKEFLDSDVFGQNPTAIVKVDAPRNHVFSTLFRVDPLPNFLTEDADKRHVRLRLSRTADFTGVFWDSGVNIPPQLGTAGGVAMGASESIYAIYTLKFVSSSGGVNSPYLVGTTPHLSGLGLLASYDSINRNE